MEVLRQWVYSDIGHPETVNFLRKLRSYPILLADRIDVLLQWKTYITECPMKVAVLRHCISCNSGGPLTFGCSNIGSPAKGDILYE